MARGLPKGSGRKQSKKGGQLMAVYKQAKSKYWWYKFTWNGEPIRESTKQTNMRIAQQMEAAHRTALAMVKWAFGIKNRYQRWPRSSIPISCRSCASLLRQR